MIKEESRFVASTVLEGMTSLSALFAAREAGVNDRGIEEILFDRAKKDKKRREFAFLEAKCRALGIPLRLCDAAELAALSIGNTHGGVIARCTARTLPVATPQNLPNDGFLCFLEGIEDPYNFGYALRSLYAAGCDGILQGERNWMHAAGVVARSSAGASEALPMWSGNAADSVKMLKSKGFRVVAAGIRDSVGLYDSNLKKPLLLLVGGEKRGLSAELLQLADQVVRIDYGRAFRGSLSAASAATVLGFEVLHQNSSITQKT